MVPPLDGQPFAHRPGCPLCSIVSTPHPRSDINNFSSISPNSPHTPWRRDSDSSSLNSNSNNASSTNLPGTSSGSGNVIIFKDANVTAYIEKKFPVSSKGHIIIVLNLHVPSIYTLSSTDIPLLSHIQNVATHLLHSLNPPQAPPSPTPTINSHSEEHDSTSQRPLASGNPDLPFRIGFITPPFKDNKIPITDHLHAHAFVGTPDLAGWWRGVAYGPLAWYAIQDLIAEIRETTSNNRVKSGYENRPTAPIDMVPNAGAAAGNADGSASPFLPLPLQANKVHLSPMPSPYHRGGAEQSLMSPTSPTSTGTSTSTAVYGRRSPANARTSPLSAGGSTSEFEEVGSGSVDLGTGYGARPEPPTIRFRDHEMAGEGLEDAGWDDGVVVGYDERRGQGEAGPSTLRSPPGTMA